MNLLLPYFAITIIFFMPLCQLGVSDKLVVMNRIGNGEILQVYCQAPVDFRGRHAIPDGQNATFNVFVPPKQFLPSMCTGRWDASLPRPFVLYNYHRDHKRCSDECVWETTRDGLFVWDKEKKMWETVEPWLVIED